MTLTTKVKKKKIQYNQVLSRSSKPIKYLQLHCKEIIEKIFLTQKERANLILLQFERF